MSDREKVIKGLECCSNTCKGRCESSDCPYWIDSICCIDEMQSDALALLKEDCHNCKLECLLQKYDELKEKYDKLLKEQEEETKFVYDEDTLPTCEKCGFHPFVGYIPTIKWMEERGYMKCPRCGRVVKWE